jgi:hypothetical protein
MAATARQREGKGSGGAGAWVAVLALLAASACREPPPAPGGDAPATRIPGSDAWLLAPVEFKSSAVRSECKLDRIAADAATLSDDEARRLYDCVRTEMALAYAKSGLAAAADYQSWPNYARAPYRSLVHARRYVNNYANDIASAYGAFEAAGALPVGSIAAKDSFSVRADGRVAFGPLAIMEKVAAEEWRYTMVMPDGWVFGTTGGIGDANVAFCADCHRAVADPDPLYFVPPRYRR